MPRRFNPLDPLGLFEKSENRERLSTGWPPSDPLGLFKSRNPGTEEGGRYLPAPPDPLGFFSRKKRVGSLENPGHMSGATIGNPIPIEFNGHLVDIKTQAREILIGKGHPPQRVDMALKWAEEWLLGMARRMAPGNIVLQKSIVQSGYAEIASRAESWLRGIEAAFAIGGAVR
ncbi:MAG: hypothetical protein Q8O76_14750 [Chloroflexota bacterium]|nr:hypothetical protein [Chloroflexota bacterium]